MRVSKRVSVMSGAKVLSIANLWFSLGCGDGQSKESGAGDSGLATDNVADGDTGSGAESDIDADTDTDSDTSTPPPGRDTETAEPLPADTGQPDTASSTTEPADDESDKAPARARKKSKKAPARAKKKAGGSA